MNSESTSTADAPSAYIYMVRWGLSDKSRVPEFNRWYAETHLPRILKVPGIQSARRLQDFESDDDPRYVTIYEIESPDVMSSEAYRSLPGWEHWRPLVIDWSRQVFKQAENLGERDR